MGNGNPVNQQDSIYDYMIDLLGDQEYEAGLLGDEILRFTLTSSSSRVRRDDDTLQMTGCMFVSKTLHSYVISVGYFECIDA